MNLDEAASAFREFVGIIKALRTPQTGCPWDLEQTHKSLRPYLIEEAYEVLDAINHNDDPHLCEELGDLLLQVVLHAQVAADRGAFSIAEVVRGIAEKMVRRHPHVFGSVSVSGSEEVVRNWEQIKAAEGRTAGGEASLPDRLGRLPESMPALMRAQRLGEKAARAGSASPPAGTFDEVRERTARLEQAAGAEGAAPEKEFGELLFGICQLARSLGLDAEESLRACNRRFVEGFRPETR